MVFKFSKKQTQNCLRIIILKHPPAKKSHDAKNPTCIMWFKIQ